MNLHRLGMACPYLDWPMRILSGMSFSLILGLLQKIRFWYCLDVLRNVWQLMAERFTSDGQSNRLSAEGERSQGCGFAAELTSNRKVWAGLVVKKLNIVYLLWTLSSAGQSNRLITGRSWVRIPERPLFFCKTGILWKITGRNWIYFFQFNRLNAEGVRRQGCGLPQPWQVTGRSWVRTPERPLLFFWKTNTFAKIAGRNWIYFFSSTGSTPKAWEASDAALPQNWQVTGRSRVRIPERPLFFTVSICSIFCTTTPYNFCIPLLSHSVCCSVCCGCFIIYKKQQ